MKKIFLIIIMFFSILPTWRNNEFRLLHTSNAVAQSADHTLSTFLATNNTNPNIEYRPAGGGCACMVSEINLNTGRVIRFLNPQAYFANNPAYHAYYLAQNGGIPPPPPPQAPNNEFPESLNGLGEPYYPEEPVMIEAIDPSQLFPTSMSGGSEAQPTNLQSCFEIGITPIYSYEFSDGETAANTNQFPFLNPPNSPCSNNFLLGGNVVSFPPSIASSIASYSFSESSIDAIKFNNTTNDVYKRSAVYDIIKESVVIDAGDPSVCRGVMGNRNIFYNKHGNYKFICWEKLGGLGNGLLGENSTGEMFTIREYLPDNEPSSIFTLPPSSIVPAQVGNTVVGVNTSGALSCQPLDCAKAAGGTASIDNCGACKGGTTGQAPCSQTPSTASYYTTLNNDTTKYYTKDTIYVPQRNTNVKLTIHKADGSTLAPNDLKWKRIDSSKCNDVIECFLSTSTLGVTVVRVDSTTKVLIVNPLAVYKVPTLYFKRGNNYNGEYGFDDSTHKYTYMRNNAKYKVAYEVKQIMNDANYFVPWLSLLDEQIITIKDSLVNFSAWAKKDKNSYIEFKATINNAQLSPLKQYYSATSNVNNLTISSTQWIATLDSLKKINAFGSLLKSVYAITNTGDTIGKMNFTCSKPVEKKIFFVNVKVNSSGYLNYSKQALLDSLNFKSHNQIFRKWVKYEPTPNLITEFGASTIDGMDTLDLSNEFTNRPGLFNNDDSLLRKIHLLYKNHKNNLLIAENIFSPGSQNNDDPEKVHFVFIVNWAIPSSTTSGISSFGSYKSVIYKYGERNKTIIHELGHFLKLNHTFPETDPLTNVTYIRYDIPQYSTLNYMDYYFLGANKGRDFYFAQWIDAY